MRTPTRQIISMARDTCHGAAVQGVVLLRYSQRIITPNELLASSKNIRSVYTLLANQFSSGVQDVKSYSDTEEDTDTSDTSNELLLVPLVHEGTSNGVSLYDYASGQIEVHVDPAEDMRVRDTSGENNHDPSVASESDYQKDAYKYNTEFTRLRRDKFPSRTSKKSLLTMLSENIVTSPERGNASKVAAQCTSFEDYKNASSSITSDSTWQAEFKKRVRRERHDNNIYVESLVSPYHRELDDLLLSRSRRFSSANPLGVDHLPYPTELGGSPQDSTYIPYWILKEQRDFRETLSGGGVVIG